MRRELVEVDCNSYLRSFRSSEAPSSLRVIAGAGRPSRRQQADRTTLKRHGLDGTCTTIGSGVSASHAIE